MTRLEANISVGIGEKKLIKINGEMYFLKNIHGNIVLEKVKNDLLALDEDYLRDQELRYSKYDIPNIFNHMNVNREIDTVFSFHQ